MKFKEWIKSLETKREQTPGEDLADSIALMIILCLVFIVVLM